MSDPIFILRSTFHFTTSPSIQPTAGQLHWILNPRKASATVFSFLNSNTDSSGSLVLALTRIRLGTQRELISLSSSMSSFESNTSAPGATYPVTPGSCSDSSCTPKSSWSSTAAAEPPTVAQQCLRADKSAISTCLEVCYAHPFVPTPLLELNKDWSSRRH